MALSVTGVGEIPLPDYLSRSYYSVFFLPPHKIKMVGEINTVPPPPFPFPIAGINYFAGVSPPAIRVV